MSRPGSTCSNGRRASSPLEEMNPTFPVVVIVVLFVLLDVLATPEQLDKDHMMLQLSSIFQLDRAEEGSFDPTATSWYGSW